MNMSIEEVSVMSGVLYDQWGNEYEPNGEGQYVIRFWDLIESGEFEAIGGFKFVVEEHEIESFLVEPTKKILSSQN